MSEITRHFLFGLLAIFVTIFCLVGAVSSVQSGEEIVQSPGQHVAGWAITWIIVMGVIIYFALKDDDNPPKK